MIVGHIARFSVTLVAVSLAVMGYAKDSDAVSKLLVDQGLPTTNLNNAVGDTNRSNVIWTTLPTDEFVSGDSFRIGNTGEFYRIDEIQVWTAHPAPTFGHAYNNINLLGGVASGGNLSILSNGTITDNTNTIAFLILMRYIV
jgi:hypothetical protein